MDRTLSNGPLYDQNRYGIGVTMTVHKRTDAPLTPFDRCVPWSRPTSMWYGESRHGAIRVACGTGNFGPGSHTDNRSEVTCDECLRLTTS